MSENASKVHKHNVRSDVDVTTLDKSLPQHIVKQIVDKQKELGLTEPEYIEYPDNM